MSWGLSGPASGGGGTPGRWRGAGGGGGRLGRAPRGVGVGVQRLGDRGGPGGVRHDLASVSPGGSAACRWQTVIVLRKSLLLLDKCADRDSVRFPCGASVPGPEFRRTVQCGEVRSEPWTAGVHPFPPFLCLIDGGWHRRWPG